MKTEAAQSLVHILDGETNEEILEECWKDLLSTENHDTSQFFEPEKQKLGENSNLTTSTLLLFQKSQFQARRLLEESLEYVANKIDTTHIDEEETLEVPILVLNTAGWARKDIAELKLEFAEGKAKSITILNDDTEVPFQIVLERRHSDGTLDMIEAIFEANVPSVGYNVYHVKANMGEKTGLSSTLTMKKY